MKGNKKDGSIPSAMARSDFSYSDSHTTMYCLWLLSMSFSSIFNNVNIDVLPTIQMDKLLCNPLFYIGLLYVCTALVNIF